VAGSSAGTVSIGSFEVSRWRDGRGGLPMGFRWARDGLCGRWIGEAGRILRGGLWFRRKWSPERRLQTRFVRIVAAARARAYHEYHEGYGAGARARLLVRDVPLTKFTNGEPPCHAQIRELMALGFEDAGSVPSQRSVQFEGKTYTEGILESLVERKREQMAAAWTAACSLKKHRPPAPAPDGAPGVETGLRLVN